MSLGNPETCPLPDDPVLAEVAQALNQAGLWAYVLDREYRVVYMTDELRRSNGGLVEMVRVPLGAHLFGSDFLDAALEWPTWTLATARRMFAAMGPWVLADAPGGSEQPALGSNLHVGNISTPGRSEVTALGDEVNQAARIEACASGGRTLASKDLVERLDATDAAPLGLDPHHINYTSLGELTTTTEKARRDAPTIPVCELPALIA